jgi:excisionase family DNA binding protein
MSKEDIPAARLLAQTILTELGHLLMANREDRATTRERPQRTQEVSAQAPVHTTVSPKSVNTQQAGELLGIPRHSVTRLIREGDLEAVKLGRYWVIPIQEIDRILAPARRGVVT